MITAIEKMNDYYKDKNIDFMHQAITLPGITKRICLNSITDPNVEIHLFNQKQQDIYQLFKEVVMYYTPGQFFQNCHWRFSTSLLSPVGSI